MLDWQIRLNEAMTEKGMTQAELSRHVGVPPPTILTWMGRGSARPIQDIRSVSMLHACRALGVRPEWLMLGELPKHPEQAWPFTTSLHDVEAAPVIVLLLIDRIMLDVLAILAPQRR